MIFDFIKKKHKHAYGKKTSAIAPALAYSGSGRVSWSARDTVSLTKVGFLRNPVGFRALKLISETTAALPLLCYLNTTRLDTHPVLSRIMRPNPIQGRTEFLESLYGQMVLSGNAYIEAVGVKTIPQELYVLRSDRMALIPGNDGWPIAYEYSVGGKKHRFSNDQTMRSICHIKSFHPQNDHYGLSSLQAAAAAIDIHNAASAWSKALLDNAARPSGAIVFTGADGSANLNEQQYDRLLAELEANHQGARNAGRPLLLEGGLDWKQMGFSPSDMEFQKTKDAAARDIAMAFGVPPMLIGIPGDATYANYQEAHRAFYRLTIIPLAKRVLDAFSVWMSEFLEEDFTLDVDMDKLSVLANERMQQWKRISEASFLSDDEKRTILGFL